jgi:hypothetical protein
VIKAALQGIADTLTGVGWDATTDPALLLPATSRNGRGALVGLPTVELVSVSGRVQLTVPVHVVAPATGTGPLLDMLPATLAALRTTNPLTPETLTVGDASLLGRVTTVTIRLNCDLEGK